MNAAEDKSRNIRVTRAQLASIFLAFCGGGFGICWMIMFAKQNTCNTTGPPTKAKLGNYPPWSVLLNDNPRNCIVECPKACYGIYTEAALMKQMCQPCVDYCVSPSFRKFPWSTNIVTCQDDAPCTASIGSISQFCRPVAMCMQDCASDCIQLCIWDKYTALWSSFVSLILLWVAFLALPLLGGLTNMSFPPLGFFAIFPMVGATILFADLWNVNMYQKGWQWLMDDTFKNVSPNYMPGLIVCLLLIGCVLMMLAYWNMENRTRHVKNMEKRVAQAPPAFAASAAQEPVVNLVPKPPPVTLEKPQEHSVTIGIEFGVDDTTGEVYIKGIPESGPAFQSVPKILIGDVVHRVWDDKDEEPAADHHWKASIETWKSIVLKSEAGTKVWFELFRKSENRSYKVSITRKPRSA